MVDLPWQSIQSPDPNREYLALLTYLPLKGYRGTLNLMRREGAVAAQLRGTPGLIGFSFRAKILRHRFWTLSVWEDEEALMTFVGKRPHADAMEALGPSMGKTDFTRFRVRGTEVPVTWDSALRRTVSTDGSRV